MDAYKKFVVVSTTFACITILVLNYPPVKPSKDVVVHQIAQYIQSENYDISDAKSLRISRVIYEASKAYGVDYRLVLALMKVESSFDHDAVSYRGARGLLQVKPSVAKFIASDAGVKWRGDKTLHDPASNVKIGLHFFKELMEDFNNTHHALYAYNMGPTRLKEILSRKSSPKTGFAGRVLKEYRTISRSLPSI